MSAGRMIQAARAGNAEAVEAMLDAGTHPDAAVLAGRTALHEAASFGRVHVVELLVKRGADIDPRDADGATPLHCAALDFGGRAAMALVAAGADIDARDKDGRTPLHWMAEHSGDSAKGVEALLEAGANPRAACSAGQTPADVASTPEIGRMIKLFSERAELGEESARAAPAVGKGAGRRI